MEITCLVHRSSGRTYTTHRLRKVSHKNTRNVLHIIDGKVSRRDKNALETKQVAGVLQLQCTPPAGQLAFYSAEHGAYLGADVLDELLEIGPSVPHRRLRFRRDF